jgi:hypothetical protein
MIPESSEPSGKKARIDHSASAGTAGEALSFTAASTFVVCRLALARSPATCRAVLAKHREFINSELIKALETVGSYSIKVVSSTPLSPFGRHIIRFLFILISSD